MTANAAGKTAMKSALNCLLNQDLITLSGFFMNEMSAFQVRTAAYKRGAEIYALGGVTEPGDGNRYVKFLSQSTFNTAMVPLDAYGSYDGVYQIGGIDVTGCQDLGDCAEFCAAECADENDTLGCKCDLGGECGIDTTSAATSSTALVYATN